MSFTPHPVIPQTIAQAVQRDARHGLDSPQPETPERQLARLRQAVNDHRAQIEAAGPLANAGELTEQQLETIAAKHAADHGLWAHIA